MDIQVNYSGNAASQYGGGTWDHYGRSAREALLDETVTLKCPVALSSVTTKVEPSGSALTIGEPSGGTVELTFGAVGRYVATLTPTAGPAFDVELLIFQADSLDSVAFMKPRTSGGIFAQPNELRDHYRLPRDRRMVLRAIANHPSDPAYSGLTDDLKRSRLVVRY